MSLTVLADAQQLPRLFHWWGAISADDLRSWLDTIAYSIPVDLIELWLRVGGGDLFETEEIFAPDGTEDDLRVVTEYLAECGLRAGLTVFHRGLWVSAIDQATGELVAFAPSGFEELARFTTFDEWYCQTLRAEYAERYGLVDHA